MKLADSTVEANVRLTVSPAEIEPLRAFARSLQPDADEFFLHSISGDGKQGVTLVDYFRLLQRLSVIARDETCHLSLRPLNVGTTDFVVDSLKEVGNLEDAMRRVAKFYNLVHGGHFNRVERRRDRLVYVIDDRAFPYAFDPSGGRAHAVVEGVLIFLHALLSLAVSGDLSASLRVVRTRRLARHASDGLLKFWTVPVRCGASAYALEYDLSAATHKIRADIVNIADPPNVFNVYETVIAMVEAREAVAHRVDFAARVSEAIASGITKQWQVARRLGVSVATLRRRLAESSDNFHDLRVQVLNETAKVLLTCQQHSSEIAETLGFADTRSFSRAFKQWNGVTPAMFANSLAAAATRPATKITQHPQ